MNPGTSKFNHRHLARNPSDRTELICFFLPGRCCSWAGIRILRHTCMHPTRSPQHLCKNLGETRSFVTLSFNYFQAAYFLGNALRTSSSACLEGAELVFQPASTNVTPHVCVMTLPRNSFCTTGGRLLIESHPQ